MALRVVFMGTPEFAVPALSAILNAGHNVVAVYTRAPAPKGRGHQVQKSPVHIRADDAGIPVFTPASFKKSEKTQQEFAALKPDVAVVAAYGLILPRSVLSAPRFGCINIHGSILPRWRGASPVHHAILAGDHETGITIMQMEEGLDTGPMIIKEAMPIADTQTTETLMRDLSMMGARMAACVLDDLARTGMPAAQVQDDAHAVYAPMLRKEDGQVDWARPAADIVRMLRALVPWPGVYTHLPDGGVLKIIAAQETGQNTDMAPGTLMDRAGHIACGGGGVIHVAQVQTPAGKRMDMGSLVNGGAVKTGHVFPS